MRNIDLLAKLHIENMTTEEKTIARGIYNEQFENEETDYNNFSEWLLDYAHSYLFEGGEDR